MSTSRDVNRRVLASVRFSLRIQPVDATHYGVSHQRSVAGETSDPLLGEPEGADVGALAERRVAGSRMGRALLTAPDYSGQTDRPSSSQMSGGVTHREWAYRSLRIDRHPLGRCGRERRCGFRLQDGQDRGLAGPP